MSRLWSNYTAASHRVMFLPGALLTVLAMLWWLFDLESRRAGGAGLGDLPGPALHSWWMLYGFFPFFIFGFLFTAAPNWLNGPAIPKRAYVASGVLMALGAVLVLVGLVVPGLALHLAGWSVAVWALFRTLTGAPPQDKIHPVIVTAAAALGCVGDAVFLVWAGADFPDALRMAEAIGVWGFLAPTFLAVCHRMIPWFTSRIVPNYVMVRPYGPLWGVLAGCLVHGALEVMERRELLWLVDLPMAVTVFWFATRWGVARGAQQVRLLSMLHIGFLWLGLSLLLYTLDSLARYAGLAWNAGNAPLHALGI
ncbi:MAG: NnrS family protein, partial [Gammaproteobacteria bacterium]|nr:NnrS family protein [Gammaproteobacteria bacterium]